MSTEIRSVSYLSQNVFSVANYMYINVIIREGLFMSMQGGGRSGLYISMFCFMAYSKSLVCFPVKFLGN